MALLTVNRSGIAAILDETAALAAATGGGDSFPNTGKEFVAIKNAGAGSITLTVKASAGANNDKCNFGVVGTPGHDLTYTIPNDSNVKIVGPFPVRPYADGSNLCQLTYSGVTSVTVGAFAATPATP